MCHSWTVNCNNFYPLRLESNCGRNTVERRTITGTRRCSTRFHDHSTLGALWPISGLISLDIDSREGCQLDINIIIISPSKHKARAETHQKIEQSKSGVVRLLGKYSDLHLQVAYPWEEEQAEIAETPGLQAHGDVHGAESKDSSVAPDDCDQLAGSRAPDSGEAHQSP